MLDVEVPFSILLDVTTQVLLRPGVWTLSSPRTRVVGVWICLIGRFNNSFLF